jgi:hypothetical protein
MERRMHSKGSARETPGKERKECLVMKGRFKVKSGRWFVTGGLLLLLIITSVGYVQAAGLSDAEKYWLTHMREEEKLARDVYLFLYDTWQSRIFKNIAASEQTHMDAVKTLLDRYGLPDPAEGKDRGEFTNPYFQDLYSDLIQDGGVSLIDAFEVGVFIEETDIADLNAAIGTSTHKDLTTVFSNLLKGSLNHLKAFNSNLAR